MIISTFWMMPTPAVSITTARLKEISLRELVERLSRSTSWLSSNLSIHLVIEIFSNLLFASRLVIDASGRGKELLKLDTGNEVLVLRSHEAVVLAKKKDLMVPLCSLGFFGKICLTLICAHVHHLLGLSYRWPIV
jgi:hypothetical protein